MAPIPKPIGERILNNIAITKTGCWEWQLAKWRNGYGKIQVNGVTTKRVHRVSYEHFVGAIPDGLVIDHLCRNKICVNPDHMEVVTHRENSLRACGWEWQTKKTECPRGHAYSDENTRLTTSGHRVCRTCHRTRENLRYHAGMKTKAAKGTRQ